MIYLLNSILSKLIGTVLTQESDSLYCILIQLKNVFYVTKCLDDYEEELEDELKVTPAAASADSSEISSSPIKETQEIESTVEIGEDALNLLNPTNEQITMPTPTPTPTTTPTPTPTPEPSEKTSDNVPSSESTKERRASHSWKGFKFKKQLSKVDLKIKSTFSNQSDKNKKNSVFHINTQQGLEAATEQSPEEDTSIVNDDGPIPQIREPVEKQRGYETLVNRPTELNLFDVTDEEKPVKPARQKDRKRFSLEKQTSRDTRLLSVPNIKYQITKDMKKSKPSNNQAFFSLLRRLSKSSCFFVFFPFNFSFLLFLCSSFFFKKKLIN